MIQNEKDICTIAEAVHVYEYQWNYVFEMLRGRCQGFAAASSGFNQKDHLA